MSSLDAEHVTLPNDARQVDQVRERLIAALHRHGYSKAATFAVRLAFEEAVSNAFRHGHRDLDDDEPIDVAFEVDNAKVRISIEDRGPGFDPSSVPDPTDTANLDKPFGRGLMLMRAYMTEVSHNARGNRVEMVFETP